jgi:hypothetical protein
MSLEDNGKALIDRVNSKGWNLYDSTDTKGSQSEGERTLRKGPVNELKIGRRYVLMPVADDPKNPDEVFSALERVAVVLNRKTPGIILEGVRYPLTGFRINKDNVKINTPEGHITSYKDAVCATQSLFDVIKMRYD